MYNNLSVTAEEFVPKSTLVHRPLDSTLSADVPAFIPKDKILANNEHSRVRIKQKSARQELRKSDSCHILDHGRKRFEAKLKENQKLEPSLEHARCRNKQVYVL